jgi:hypothetical protein
MKHDGPDKTLDNETRISEGSRPGWCVTTSRPGWTSPTYTTRRSTAPTPSWPPTMTA